jgi:ERCC4-type nuclease
MALFPAAVLIDTREQIAFTFEGLKSDAKDGCLPLRVETKRATLASGDYSIDGFPGRVAVERKSLEDLYATLGRGRNRFQCELERLADLDFAAVVVEADWPTVLRGLPERSRLNPKTVFRSVIAWQQRFRTVHWWFCPGRSFAEAVTLRLLERFWKDHAQS